MKRYLYIEWKRALRLLPTIALIDLILLVLSGMIGVQLAKNQQGDEAQQKVRMGIVGDIEASPELRLGLYALENFDHSKYVVDLLPMEEEEAKEAIMRGKINAYFIIPEGFVESVGSYADDKPIRYVSTDGAVTIGTQQVDEIVESLASMLTEVQSSIYGMQLIVSGAREGLRVDILGDEMLLRYGEVFLEREDYLDLETIGIRDELSITGGISTGIFILFLLLSGISLAPLYLKDQKPFYQLLKIRSGVGAFRQVLSILIVHSVLVMMEATFVFVVLYAVCQKIGFIGELEILSGLEALRVLAALPIIVILISLMHLVIYEGIRSVQGSLILIFMLSIFLGYFSGCLYPVSFFPETLQKLTVFQPVGASVLFFGHSLLLQNHLPSLCSILIWILGLFMLCVLIRERRIRG
ncbi:MAG: ABC-2 transporter permease [Firmicutes bacterium]|nr:ABC-2 transporter permease [Bacillota bacterium]